MIDKMPKKKALKGLISAMKGMNLERMKGYSKPDDDMPAVEAIMKKKKKKHEDDDD